jgi:hypothetical protein
VCSSDLDKKLAIIVFKYAKEKSVEDFDKMKEEVLQDLENDIKRMKN